jgi:hypothetical protein
MNELDKMLDPQTPSEMALPPLVQYWKRRSEAGDRIEVELYRPDAAGGLSGTDLVIHRWEYDKEQAPESVEWDDGINSGLLELGIKAINLEQEGRRFALGIRSALRKVERRYGDGYLSSVFVDLMNDSDLAKEGEIADVLKYVHTYPPERSRTYDDCQKLIANEIGGRAVELRDKLKYKPEEIKEVMTKALAIYLDERFSVSSRRALGWL